MGFEESSVALMKKALVEFCSFEDVVGELRRVIRETDGHELPPDACRKISQSLRTYDIAVQPSRELLRTIRNTLAAHRTGFPGERESRRFGEDFKAWGAWEQQIVELESHCNRERWVDALNAAIVLRNVVADEGIGHWFSSQGNTFKAFIPIRST